MTPKRFDYVRPADLRSAIDCLVRNPDAKILAGGQSLIALMKLRLASPKYLIDIANLEGLSQIEKLDDQHIEIGALTTHENIEDSDLLQRYCPILPQMAGQIGDQQIRNRGTLGGSLVHADPSGDPPAAILALDAKLKISGPESTRTVSSKDFFLDTFTTCLATNEVLTEVVVPVLGPEWSSTYRKYAWREGDFAIVGFAGMIQLDNYSVRTARFAFASMGNKPLRALKLESEITGKELSTDLIERAEEVTCEGLDPSTDIHVSAGFRKNVAKNLVSDFLTHVYDGKENGSKHAGS